MFQSARQLAIKAAVLDVCAGADVPNDLQGD